jgi:cell fate (sporulation/competence/biofilm development) regulator YmcA (YheA/YmcA/DUF963 family)
MGLMKQKQNAALKAELSEAHNALKLSEQRNEELRESDVTLRAQNETMHKIIDDYIHLTTTLKAKLNNLLAVIHGDGGHYTGKHGDEKSYADAMLIASGLRAENVRLRHELLKYAENGECSGCPDFRKIEAKLAEAMAVCTALDEFQKYFQKNAMAGDRMPGNEFYSDRQMVIVRQARAILASIEEEVKL